MLVTFSTPAHGDVTMFGDVAIGLLKMMGRGSSMPSALYAQDVQAALERLKAAVDPARSRQPNAAAEDGEEGEEPVVSISHRALPLIELLEAAAHENCAVMWESNE
ncbi:MAG: DUF1840 domain-containing protein [Haliea sp.]|nr:DUF1840 domain-containing protein [Haliea sp.]